MIQRMQDCATGGLRRTASNNLATPPWSTVRKAALIRQADGTDAATTGKYLVVWRRQDNGQWLIHADIAKSDDL